jgi:hypothetical protein
LPLTIETGSPARNALVRKGSFGGVKLQSMSTPPKPWIDSRCAITSESP